MKCINCLHLNLRDNPKHANVGYGRCKLEPLPGVFESMSIERNCSRFERAAEEKIIKRIAWREQIEMFR